MTSHQSILMSHRETPLTSPRATFASLPTRNLSQISNKMGEEGTISTEMDRCLIHTFNHNSNPNSNPNKGGMS